METIKTLLLDRFRLLSALTISMTLSIVLLMIRIKLNQSYYLLFLVWNLFLAVIPYGITTALLTKPKLHKLSFAIIFIIWLVFLPNAPYIITDLLHLTRTNQQYLWLDILVITSFAFNGLILFFLSLSDMERLLKQQLNHQLVTIMRLSIFGLTAFGIYLGRFLRYNSWEIINNPTALLSDMFALIFEPNLEAWAFTLTFASFLAIFYWILKAFSGGKTSS